MPRARGTGEHPVAGGEFSQAGTNLARSCAKLRARRERSPPERGGPVFGRKTRSAAGALALTPALAALEELHRALVLLGGLAACEGAEVAPPPGLWIFLARVEAVATRFQLPDHLI